MPSKEFELRLQDMLTAIAVVEATIADLNAETFAQNSQVLREVLYSLAVISEVVISAIGGVEIADSATPWQQISGLQMPSFMSISG